ncbi:c-type cytochrome biogenesis protein CcmI [Marinobacter sp. 1-3A]|uniref:c-type cytochrome biogenesis protein CcmI n=1 Tax=unclassified Marinobacter TaxID=83889 RepID=UPI001902D9D6|nr:MULTISPECIES: c-type cytochrome biogenesis protein CcmI [unclassified Marinobacter]MBK1872065.1 c-type cytochrome biogenesis protein CcmI [Marinobacter sp. 1-3A]MBK1885557.1 c-type cytochrome biogenesis protein CcmI [Marinobacter sp. DY40_1A1]
MTQTFWIAATVLIILALAFVIYPVMFHRRGDRQQTDLRNQNLMAYRSRMAELEKEHQAGIIDEETYQQLRDELAGAMLDDVPENEAPAKSIPGRKAAMAVGLVSILLIPAATVVLYDEWGALDSVEAYIAMQELGGSDEARAAQMDTLTEQLRERLEASPDNPDGWAMLGQTYMRLERYEDAAWAFRQLADSVKSDDGSRAVALGLSAQALFFRSQGAMTDKVTATIEEARSLNPDEVNSLGLLGIHSFSQGDYREAIQYWERIQAVAPDHPQLGAIQGGIKEAYTRLGEQPPAQEPAFAAADDSAQGMGVTVSVSLDEAFKQDIPEDTTLFIFARAANVQSGPPLAVVRLTASALPVDIRLDDRYAMTPEAVISGVEEVAVTARLTRSGSINAQAGDWQGSTDTPITVTKEQGAPVSIVINKQLTGS